MKLFTLLPWIRWDKIYQQLSYYQNKRYWMSRNWAQGQIIEAEEETQQIDYILKPYKARQMTDTIWIWIYSIFSLIVITAFFYTFIRGKDDNLFKPRDPNFRRCGQEGTAQSEYKYIYFPAPFFDSINKSVCVKSCPKTSDAIVECLPNRMVSKCQFNMTDHMNRSNQFIIYPTRKNKALSMCQPTSRILFDSVNQKINTHYLFLNFQKLYESIPMILIASPIITLVIVAFFMFFVLNVQPYAESEQNIKFITVSKLQNQNLYPPKQPINVPYRSSNKEIIKNDPKDKSQQNKISKGLLFLFYGIPIIFGLILIAFFIYSWLPAGKRVFVFMPIVGSVIFGLFIFIILYFIYYRSYFVNSVRLLSLGICYIKQNPFLIFLSVATFFLFIIIFIFQILTLLFLYAIDSNPPAENSNQPYSFAYFTAIGNAIYVKILLVFAAIHFVWTILILFGMVDYLAMSSAAFWICNVKHNFKNGLYSLLKFHLGSVIKGAVLNNTIGLFVKLSYLCVPGRKDICCRCCRCPGLKQCYKGRCFTQNFGIFNDLNYVRISVFGEQYNVAGKMLSHTMVVYMNEVSRAYRLARALLLLSKFLVAFVTTLISYFLIELSSTMRGYFLSNIFIFLISFLLTDLAFASYDRSYQVILLTILIKKDEKQCDNDETNRYLRLYNLQKETNEQRRDKKNKENSVRKWFHQFQAQKQNQNQNV